MRRHVPVLESRMRFRLLLAAMAVFLPFLAQAQTTVLTPTPIQRFVDNNGNALVGGLLYVYLAGTTTKATTYTDSTGNTQQTNPVVLNTRGEPENTMGNSVGVWLTPGTNYKMVLAPAGDTDPPTNPIWTLDNISPPPLSGGPGIVSVGGAGTLPSTDCGKNIYASGGFYTITVGQPTGYLNSCALTIVNSDTQSGKTIAVFGKSSFILWPGQSYTIQATTASVWSVVKDSGPWDLPNDVQIWVNGTGVPAACGLSGEFTCSAGNDNNDGLMITTPMNTLQAAVNRLYTTFRPGGANVTIILAHGTTTNYALSCGRGSLVGTSTFAVAGDGLNPFAVVIQAPNVLGAQGVFVTDLCTPSFQDLTIIDNASNNAGALASITKEGQADFRGVVFGACTVCVQLEVNGGGAVANVIGVSSAGNTNVLRGSAALAFSATGMGSINFANQGVSVPNVLAYSTAFASITNGGNLEELTSSTFTGAGAAGTTGTKCIITGSGLFDTQAAAGFDPNSVFLGSVNCIPQNGWTEFFTAGVRGSSTAGTPSYAATCGSGGNKVCSYGTVRVVNSLVHVTGKIITTGLGGATGNLQITGLPIVAGAAQYPGSPGAYLTDDQASCVIGFQNGWTASGGAIWLSGIVQGGENVIRLVENLSGGTSFFAPVADFAAGTTLSFSCTYHS